MYCLSNNKVCAQSTNNFYRIFFGVQKNNQDSSCDHCAKVGTVNKDPGATFESQVRRSRSHQFVAFGRLFPVELHRARSERADATSRSLRSAVIECSLAMVAWRNEQSKWHTQHENSSSTALRKLKEAGMEQRKTPGTFLDVEVLPGCRTHTAKSEAEFRSGSLTDSVELRASEHTLQGRLGVGVEPRL